MSGVRWTTGRRAGQARRPRRVTEELERKVALTAPTQKKVPVPSPYAPGTLYGLAKRANLQRGSGGG